MKKFVVKYSFWVFLLIVQLQKHCNGCLEKEREGLLELKTFLKSYSDKDYNPLSTWVDDKESECCSWERIKCNSTTGRVMELSLQQTTNFTVMEDRFLNASLFHPFEELTSLNLSETMFGRWVVAKGFEGLRKLVILDLGLSLYNNSIFPVLTVFSPSLKTLILGANRLTNPLPFQELSKLRYLEVLNLKYNGFMGSLRLQGFSNLTNLRVLVLSGNYFEGPLIAQGVENMINLELLELGRNVLNGSIPLLDLAKLRQLKYLDLSENGFSGDLPEKGLCEMINLVELALSYNDITGHIPECIGNLTQLQLLDVSSNKMIGNIPSSISKLTNLEFLSLYDNYFEGLFLFSSLFNHSKLQLFLLTSKAKNLQVETENPPWKPAFQLRLLVLKNCNLNKQAGSIIPGFLLFQHDLRYIDLSYNNLVGSFPSWILQNNSELQVMDFSNNAFAGALQLPNIQHDLLVLRVGNNELKGELPKDIGQVFPKLTELNLSMNGFEGSFPSSMGEMVELQVIDFSRNNISSIARHLFKNCSSIMALKLSHNQLSGKMYLDYANESSLDMLFLDNNYFTEMDSNGEELISTLLILDVSNNLLSGEFPAWIGNLSTLQLLQMSENNMEGEISSELCNLQNLEFLDLSENNFTGSLPSCFNYPSMKFLYLQKNNFSGLIPDGLSESLYLRALDLSSNELNGIVPTWISELKYLQIFLLRRNEFAGEVPLELCRMEELRIVDLSLNKLNGSIPYCLSNISSWRAEPLDYAYAGGFVAVFGTSYGDTNTNSYYNATLDFHFYTDASNLFAGPITVEFTTKQRLDTYEGSIVKYMTGLDLSSNEFIGAIPDQIGNLPQLRAMNLSRNSLSGSIPKSFSNLKHVESLDLSFNNLTGVIPPQLVELNFLSTFNVSYNNLSGSTPSGGQFGLFDDWSYVGNSFLCGELLTRTCTSSQKPSSTAKPEEEADENWIDMVPFFWSFAAAYVTLLLGLLTALCINRRWRLAWFYFIDVCCSKISKIFGL